MGKETLWWRQKQRSRCNLYANLFSATGPLLALLADRFSTRSKLQAEAEAEAETKAGTQL